MIPTEITKQTSYKIYVVYVYYDVSGWWWWRWFVECMCVLFSDI